MTEHYCDRCKHKVPPPTYSFDPEPASSCEVTLPVWAEDTLIADSAGVLSRTRRDFKRVLLCVPCADRLRGFMAAG